MHTQSAKVKKSVMAAILVTLVILFGLKYCNSQTFVCCNGALRLVGGSISSEGRVEICLSGQWKTICDNNWSENEARVVCSQLGYTTEGAVPLIRAMFGTGMGTIVEQVRCNGTERQLVNCTMRDITDGECEHNEDAGVRCRRVFSCQNGELRLQGSTISGRGRVEVCRNNVWGTVCDDFWNSANTGVVCNQLGFSRFGASSYCCARYGQGSGPIHMDDVRCAGIEASLIDCPHTTNHNCIHFEDVSVQCQTRVRCHDGEVRLIGGSQRHEGRVEVCFNETWGTICDYISSLRWNSSEADIVCKQLGYSRAEKSTFGFGRGGLPVLVKLVYCRGHESNLGECTYYTTGLSNCFSYGSDVIGVHCISETVNNGEVRLTNGLHKYAGRVEIYWNSEWRTICYDGWDVFDAQVICRQLNYLSTSIQIQGAQCVENTTQLESGLSQREGFILFCHDGDWGKVVYGNAAAAIVVCRQLGFSTEDAAPYYFRGLTNFPHYGPPILWSYVECVSTEIHISQCNHVRPSSSLYRELFGIMCQVKEETVPGAPRRVQISTATDLSIITLTWSPPLVSERHGLSIYGYIINCSTDSDSLPGIKYYTDIFNVTISNLHPFTTYNCCIAARSSHGSGRFACVIIPTRVPTKLKIELINSMTLLLSWHAPDADEYSYLVQQYYIEATNNSLRQTVHYHYTTENTYLLMNNLRPNHLYTFRVAAYTKFNGTGPFSKPITTVTTLQHSPNEGDSSIISLNQDPSTCVNTLILSLASILGLISFILLITVIMVGIFICYRLCKCGKKVARPVDIYEMVDMPRSHRGDTITKPGNYMEDIDGELILKQEQAKDISHLPHEYFMPPIDQNVGPGQVVATNEENTYQPLIPPQIRALGDAEKSEYHSLIRKTSITPANNTKINISPMPVTTRPAPPAIPPKPKAM